MFRSPNYPPLGFTKSQDIRIFWENTKDYAVEGGFYSKELDVVERYSPRVLTLTLTPSLSDSLLELIYGESSNLCDAVIIEAFGLGNLPSNTRLKDLIAQKTKQGSRS